MPPLNPDPRHSPLYQRNRRARLKRARYRCETCRKSPTPNSPLECHHFDGNPKNHAIDNLRMLCHTCHLELTRRQRKEQPEKFKQRYHPNLRLPQAPTEPTDTDLPDRTSRPCPVAIPVGIPIISDLQYNPRHNRPYSIDIAIPGDEDPTARRSYRFRHHSRANQVRTKLLIELETQDAVIWIEQLPKGERAMD